MRNNIWWVWFLAFFVMMAVVPAGNAEEPSWVRVEFRGLITHIVDGSFRRAVLLKADGHGPKLTLPVAYKKQLAAIFKSPPPDCGTDPEKCTVTITGAGLRLVGTNGELPTNQLDVSDHDFRETVPKLGPYISFGDFKPGVDDEIPTDPVTAYFVINRGEYDVVPFDRPGKFVGQGITPKNQLFAGTVILKLTFPTQAVLQVRTAGKEWNQQEITLAGGITLISVSNETDDAQPPSHGHFKLFENLSTKTPGFLPNIEWSGKCAEPCGGVPGCGNTQWP